MTITPLLIEGNKNGAQELTKFMATCVRVCVRVLACVCIDTYPKFYVSNYTQ